MLVTHWDKNSLHPVIHRHKVVGGETTMTIMEEIQAAFPDAKIGNVADPDCKIAAWLRVSHPKVTFSRFLANEDMMGEGRVSCLDIAFQYDPFWEEVAKKER
jgi:hypothetical protein